MTLTTLLLVGLGFGLAYVNGANDVSKGIATLVGSGVSDYRRAMRWGAIWTAAGGLLAAVLASAMVATFGNGFFAGGTTPTLTVATAALIGAGAWILIATRTGLPVSTTHALVGSVSGVAVVAYGFAGVQWSTVSGKILVPLLLSPVVSFALVTLLLRAQRAHGSAMAADCLCADLDPSMQPQRATGTVTLPSSAVRLSVVTGPRESCALEHPQALRVTVDHLHWLTSGAASFARGLNDAPKIAAIVLAATVLEGTRSLPSHLLFAVVTSGMVLGSVIAGRRVTQVLAEKVTPMDHREGFFANVVTAGLVAAGAALGWPMSTTHVSSGGIVAAGVERSALNKQTLRHIALAWVVTLPASATLGVAAYAAGAVFFE